MKRFKFTFDSSDYIINYITDFDEAYEVAKKIKESNIQNWGLDIETFKKLDHPKAGLDPHLSGISLVQLFDGDKNVYVFDCIACEGLHWFTLVADKNFVAHYGIFEIKHLTHAGFPNLKIGCSMLLSILVDRAERSPFTEGEEPDEDDDEPSTWKGYGLDAIIGRLFNLRIDKRFQLHKWHERPLASEPLTYAALDAILTYRISTIQIKKVVEYKMLRHYHILKLMQHVIAEMELNGVKIDRDKHQELITQWASDLEKQKIECAKYFADVNLNSTKQLGNWARGKYSQEILDQWIKTKTGALGFGKNALAEMHHLPEVEALLTYKKTSKLLSTYGESLLQETNPVTHRVHCSFSLGETRTGRLSSRSPNLQNLPRESSMRGIFVAGPGNKLVVADFNQIELRVAGIVSGDSVINGAYERGDDLHSVFASRMYGVPLSRVTKEQRQIAKSANFGAIYGMGPTKFVTYCLASTGGKLRLSFEQAQNTINALWDLYKVYGAWCRKIRERAEEIGFVRTPCGKMRKLHPSEVYTKAPNTIVQGGAFEVMAEAMLEYKARRDTMAIHSGGKIINSVHDEIIIEVPEHQSFVTKLMLENSMILGLLKVFPKAVTNGLANAVICDNWAEGKV